MNQFASCGKTDPRVKEQAAIKTRLMTAGITTALIDREHGLADGTCRNTLREPNTRGERAIAAALKTHPHLLWPSRYTPNGQRREPQNYNRVPTLAQRRNGGGKLAAMLVAGCLIMPLFLAGDSARAHEFYSYECCSDKDCFPLPEGAVEATPDGWLIKASNVSVPFDDKRIKHSPDGRFHGCFLSGNPNQALLCLYVPEFGS